MNGERIIISIGRQYGSGGREIGKRLAKEFNIDFYDKELITLAAKESGFSEEILKENDENHNGSFLYSLVMGTYTGGNNLPLNHKLFLAQFDTIKKVAEEGPCIIVGRCADYALHDFKNCINLFIYGDEEVKIKRIMRKYNLTEDKAREMITKKDKQRQSYYNYYSSKKWGRADSYDFCLNSSVLGVDGTVKLIVQMVEDFEALNGVTPEP